MESDLFYKSVTAEHFYVTERTVISIDGLWNINGTKHYFVNWSFAGVAHTEYLSIEKLKFIADAMEIFYGSTDQSTVAWNSLYLRCYHEEFKNDIHYDD